MRNNDDVMLLSAYLDGALSTDERTALEARLSSEPELREELEELRYVVSLLREMPLQKAPRSYALDPAIFGRKAAPVRKIIYPWRSLGAVAAAVMIMIAGVLFFASSGGDESMEQASDSVSQNPTALLSPTVEGQIEVANAPTRTVEGEDRSEDEDSGATALFYDTTAESTLNESLESETAQGTGGLVQQAQATDQLVTPYDPFAAEGYDPEQQAMESGGVPPGGMPEGQTAPQAGGDVPPSLGAGAGGGGDDVPFSEMPAPMPTMMPAPTEHDQEEDDAASVSAASEAAAPAVPPSAADSPSDAAGESEPESAASFADDDLARKTELFHQVFNDLTGIFRRIDMLLGWNG